MTGVDWVIVVAVVLSMALAAKEGFFYEVFSLAGVVVGYLLAAWEYGHVAGWFSPYTRAQWVAEIGAFLLIFLAVVAVASLVGRITRWTLKEVGLRWFDRLLGAAFGLLRGVLVIAVIVLAMASFTPGVRLLSGSALSPYFLVLARAASWVAPAAVRDRFRQGMDGLHNIAQPSAAGQVSIPAPGPVNRSQVLLITSSLSKRKGVTVKDQLEALITQMYKSGILYSEAVREFKKRFILTVLQDNSGNQCRAARQLGMHRNTLSRTIQELKIDIRGLRDGVRRPPRSARPLTLEKKAAR